jgi:hypothetical protein
MLTLNVRGGLVPTGEAMLGKKGLGICERGFLPIPNPEFPIPAIHADRIKP